MKSDRPRRRVIIGKVVSDKMEKTVTIEFERRKRHPVYKKFVKSYVKVKAHDEKNEASVGDIVKAVQTRPLSKQKSCRVIEILEKA